MSETFFWCCVHLLKQYRIVRPSSAKRKGKLFEDKVAQQLHIIFLQTIPEYRNYVAATYRIGNISQVQVRRNLTSGNIGFELGDIYLPETVVNWFVKRYTCLPIIECKKQKVFDLRKPNQLLQNLIKANGQLMKQVDSKIKIPIPNVKYTMHLIVFSGHYDRIIWCALSLYDYLDTKHSRWLNLCDSDMKLRNARVTLHSPSGVSIDLFHLTDLKDVLLKITAKTQRFA